MRSCAYRNEEELRQPTVMTTQAQAMSGGRNNRAGLAQELLRDDMNLEEGDQPSLMTLRRVVHEVLWVKDCASEYRWRDPHLLAFSLSPSKQSPFPNSNGQNKQAPSMPMLSSVEICAESVISDGHPALDLER